MHCALSSCLFFVLSTDNMHKYAYAYYMYNVCAIFVLLICCVRMLHEKVKFHFVPETKHALHVRIYILYVDINSVHYTQLLCRRL